MPTRELLHKIYSDLETGYPENKAMAKQGSLQHVWYSDILKSFSLDRFQDERIADIGSGEGFLALAILQRMAGNSFLDCYDIHGAPPAIIDHPFFGSRVAWLEEDVQALVKGERTAKSYDRVFLVSIIEHVPNPMELVKGCLSMLNVNGHLHVIGPLLTGVARAMGRHWPYLIPGEHLTIPTMKGLERMAEQLKARIKAKKIPVTYSLKYAIGAVLGLEIPAWLDVALRLPLGAFAATFVKMD
jgi:hypothetical protein